MRLARRNHRSDGPHWPVLLLTGAVASPLLWFAMMHPLWPTTPKGWLAGMAAGMVAGVWFVASALLIVWLERQTRYRMLCKAVGALAAISLGAAVFWFALKGQAFVAANFSYFGR